MKKKMILKENIQAYLKVSKSSYQDLAGRINASPTSLFNWAAGGAVTLNDRNIQALQCLANEIDIDLPFLLFPIDTAERFLATHQLEAVIGPHLKSLWSELSKEIRKIVRSEFEFRK